MADISSSQLNEIWLTAMDALIYSRLEKLDYDKTIKATVVKDRGNGIYTVEQDGVIKFDAYSYNGNKYNIKDEVYILVPQNDYSSSKVIVGKTKKDNESNIVNYVSALNTIASTDNILPPDMVLVDAKIQANGSGIKRNDSALYEPQLLQLGTIDLTNTSLKHNFIYDTLGVSANFKTLFSKIDMLKGNYGLLFRLIMEDGEVFDAVFDSSEMFGNPYNYMTYFKQDKLFDLSKYETSITHIGIYLYEQGNFEHQYQDEICVYTPKYLKDDPIYDIMVDNIYITFGDNIIPIADNTFSLKVDEDKSTALIYNSTNYTKDIQSFWYNKSAENQFIGFTDGVVDDKYDELSYLQELTNTWGGAQITASNVPPLRESLQLYYNSTQINQKLQTLYAYAGRDLDSLINNLDGYVGKFDLADEYKYTPPGLDAYTSKLQIASGLHETQKGIHDKNIDYLKILYDNYIILSEQKEKELTEVQFDENIITQVAEIVAEWNTIQVSMDSWFNTLQSIPAGYDLYGDIRAYADRQKRQFIKLKELITPLLDDTVALSVQNATLAETTETRLNNKQLKTFNEEYQEFQKLQSNKYCIYWYQMDKEAEGDAISGPGWRRLIWDVKPGMPEVMDGEVSYAARSKILATITLDPEKEEEKIKAVLFFNHNSYWSNELVFTNENPPSTPAPKEEDTISIVHGKNSNDSFQKYSATLALVNSADTNINRELFIQYNSIDENITSVEALGDTVVYWYIPIQNTMLKVNYEYLNEIGFSRLSSMLNVFEANGNTDDFNLYKAYEKPGFECFFKEIKKASALTDSKIYYSIQPLYSQTANLNTIYCLLEKEDKLFNANITFSFSTYGTAGTQYTLSITPLGSQSAIEKITQKPLIVEISFSGFEGATIENPPLVTPTWITEVDNPSWAPAYREATDKDLVSVGVTDKKNGATYLAFNRSVDFSKCLYNVFEAQVQWNNNDKLLLLKAQCPIAQSDGAYYLDGPTTVYYNSNGNSPAYIHKPYRLFYRNTNAEITGLTWALKHYDMKGNEQDVSKIGQYLPKLIHQEVASPAYPEIGYYLRPLNMYVANVDTCTVVIAYQGTTPIFAQPIYIGQNQWESDLLNSWDESLTIDKKNGIILSTMMGAGFKDEQNRFNGVLMGDVGSTADVEDIGLYGFHEGAQSFGFDARGTAFIGKEGRGRINFDGRKGTIESASFESNNGDCGMKIDLDDGKIEIKGSTKKTIGGKEVYNSDGTQSYLRLSSQSPYLQLEDKNGFELMRVSDSAFYLQSADYANDKSGVKLDLFGRRLDAGTFKISAGTTTGNYITIDSDANNTYPLKIGSEGSAKFKVDWDGRLYSTGGEIGGWDITANGIEATTYGSVYLYSNSPSKTVCGETRDDWRIVAGSNFGVNKNGTIWANDARIKGKITATSGKIGNWYIQDGSIYYSEDNGVTKKMTLTDDGKINNNVGGKATFIVTNRGITATAGELGGWSIGEKAIYRKNSQGTSYDHYWGEGTSWYNPITSTTYSNIVFKCGDNFSIDKNGVMRTVSAQLQSATITGSSFKIHNKLQIGGTNPRPNDSVEGVLYTYGNGTNGSKWYRGLTDSIKYIYDIENWVVAIRWQWSVLHFVNGIFVGIGQTGTTDSEAQQ